MKLKHSLCKSLESWQSVLYFGGKLVTCGSAKNDIRTY